MEFFKIVTGWVTDKLKSLFAPRWPYAPMEGVQAKLCRQCCPTGDPKDAIIWPDDIREEILDRDQHEYSLKLENVRPEHFKKIGVKLLNMAYEDPSYQSDGEEEKLEVDLLPPPPEPSDAIKAMDYPLISINVKGIGWPEVEEIGEMFDETADLYEDYEKGKEVWQPTDETVPRLQEAMESYYFDWESKLADEITQRHKLTNSDFIPGTEPDTYRADIDEWVHKVCGEDCEKDFNVTPYTNLRYAPYFKNKLFEHI